MASSPRSCARSRRDEDYEVDEKKRTVGILEAGVEKVEKSLGLENLYSAENTPLIAFLNNALRAKELFKRDKEYVVLAGEVDIVDEHTGRLLKGRRYSEGLHQAIEAKEGVPIKAENQTFASITLQNYFRLYTKLAGMTGTAQTEAAELHGTYGMNVLPIPTNLPMIRIDQPDLLYKNEQAKYDAIVDDIVDRNEAGQPVLVGTTSVEKSERLSKELKKHGIAHEILNAKEHEREAAIVAEAGRKGAVTVATNMAGRGTDIMLGGNPEFRAVAVLAKKGIDPHDEPEKYEAQWHDVFAAEQKAVAKEHDEVVAAGGLYVLGTERHESRRIDNQLRGRSGRQGDPGESRFYLSLEDDLMRLFQTGLAATMMNSSAFPDDMPIESKVLTRGVRSAQAQIEGRNHEARKSILKYDDVMSGQRSVIYAERRRILAGEDFGEQIRGFINDVVEERVAEMTSVGNTDDWDLEGLIKELRQIYPVSLTAEELLEDVGGTVGLNYGVPGARVPVRRPAALLRGRGAHRRGDHAAGGAAGGAPGARLQVARSPVRDGLPARGHRPAGHGPARPAHGVPARGPPDVRDGGRRHQGVERLRALPRRAARPERAARRQAARGAAGQRGFCRGDGDVPRGQGFGRPRPRAARVRATRLARRPGRAVRDPFRCLRCRTAAPRSTTPRERPR